ncbi:TBC1 domain family member whacked [Onthophagus taurus]|uniref:TBC1 domain family member whacked n=1 Tax=Onthophagus taurus TaxID=166361 RepID=UPI000C20FAF6|nr:TBC1 domain family member 10A [Onthophagus taurus]
MAGASAESEVSSICSVDRYGFLKDESKILNGTKETPTPETVIRREHKWLSMLSKWEYYTIKDYKKLRNRCYKGIPMSIRPRAWLYLCGGKILLDKHPDKYEELIRESGDVKCLDEIKKDLHRQFPYHEMFISEEKPGQQELFNVLKAYTVYNPSAGYCQAQAPVAAFLLMHMPSIQAFWCLVRISDKYLQDYYSPSMEIVQRDGLILQALLKKLSMPSYKHLKKVNAEPMLYCTEWFLCAFTRTLPWDTLLRIWDVFLCEGVKVLFKTALVILIGCLGKHEQRKKCPGLYETLQLLRNPPEHVLTEEYLIFHINKLNLTERDFEVEHVRQTMKMKNQKHDSSK